MNQKGMVQPIGGTNEKFEGYFKVCQQVGITGKQGVLIPVQNKDNLMLDDDLIKAVDENNFSIYSVENIDQAIELMMGKSADEVHKKVQEVLSKYADKVANFDGDDESE